MRALFRNDMLDSNADLPDSTIADDDTCRTDEQKGNKRVGQGHI